MYIRCAYLVSMIISMPCIALAALFRLTRYKSLYYVYPLTHYLRKYSTSVFFSPQRILFFIRILALALLALIIAQPQLVDKKLTTEIEGVPIILTLDVSGSMECIDDLNDPRSRLEILKAEAIRFVGKRQNDSIGLVFFAGETLFRCPVTNDSNIVKNIISSIKLGDINPEKTFLASGIATAVNHLKNSKSKNKVIILLTDGIPSGDSLSVTTAISLAQKFGVKIYAIGIGGEAGGYINTPFGYHPAGVPLDMSLLENIAEQTGGKAFRARNIQEMRAIYDTIDALEKSKTETNLFHNYKEAYVPLLLLVFALLCLEIFLKFHLWRGIL